MAKYSGWGLDLSFKADVDFSASQWCLVRPASTAGYVELANTANSSVLGVIQNDPKAGEEATVRVLGTTKVRSNADASALSWGRFLKSGSDGMVAGYLSYAASVNAVGLCLEALSSGSGILTEMFVYPAGLVRG
jgi:hypothetical protein